jgi:colicin import membrane protein
VAAIHPGGAMIQVFGERREPGRVPAALLAIIVHAGFFAVIMFGVSWQVRHPAPLVAELWDQLPNVRNAPEPAPPPPPPPAPEPEPEVKKPVKVAPLTVKPTVPQVSKADIELKARKEKAEREREEQVKREQLEKKKQAELEKKRKDEEAARKAAKAAEDRAKADAAERAASAANAARNQALNDYAAKIRALITGRANIPDTVSGKPIVEVRLRLLVNGAVFDAQVIKPSGNRVYDEAVERAINGIQNWPLPQNAELFGGRRELILRIEHER